jgi:hypothetical protein
MTLGCVVGVTGVSEAGKPSLLRAGLLPTLARGVQLKGSEHWSCRVIMPTKDPLTELATALAVLGSSDTAAARPIGAVLPPRAALPDGGGPPVSGGGRVVVGNLVGLRCLYLRNELAKGEMELAGHRLSLPEVKNDAYVVGAVNDHIVPWPSSYQATRLLGGNVRYILSSGGHIAGIVNPPGPKAWYEAADDDGLDAEGWRAANSKHRGSWWEDWTVWSESRAGSLIEPPHMGSRKHPAIADAPGEYVFG